MRRTAEFLRAAEDTVFMQHRSHLLGNLGLQQIQTRVTAVNGVRMSSTKIAFRDKWEKSAEPRAGSLSRKARDLLRGTVSAGRVAKV